MTNPFNDLAEELDERSRKHRLAWDTAQDGDPVIGSYVFFMRPTLHGPARTRGKVTREVNGKYEVRVAEGGYYMLASSEISNEL